MITFDGYTARIIQVGGDSRLADEIGKVVDSHEGWLLDKAADVEAAIAQLLIRDSLAVILVVDSNSGYAQVIKYLNAVDAVKTPTIVVHNDLGSSQHLELLRRGVVECLSRPLSMSRLALVLEMLAAPGKAGARKPIPSGTRALVNLGLSESLLRDVRAVAPLDTTVLITGETGVGKTRLTRLIHGMSPRIDRPFLAVNCGALTETLLDSDLFGHKKGAFTGADRDHDGKLSQAADGTLLLDEIDALSPAAQVKLLQVTEDRVFQPVGSVESLPLRARLIVASNKVLEEEVAAGRFRADLYYRLNVMSFQLLPLRERRHEIAGFVSEFVAEFSAHHGLSCSSVSAEAMAALESHAWPGNVRELRNTVERAVILSSGNAIDVSHLPSAIWASVQGQEDAVSQGQDSNKLVGVRGAAERAKLLQALQQNANNRTKTAAYLGISRVALYKRLRKFHIL